MKFSFTATAKFFALSALTVTVVSCSNGSQTPQEAQKDEADSIKKENKQVDLKPAGAAPSWGTDIKPEMQVVVEKLASLGGKPIETLDAKEARMQPSPADAVKAVMQEHNMAMPPMLCDTIGKDIGGGTHVRIYTPKDTASKYPVIVYYHGGGWVIANNDTYNASIEGLCEGVKAIVVAVDYPQGPEHKFPAAHAASFAAYEWTLKNISSMKGDTSKIAVVGESAGGNLAASVSMMARDKKIKLPVYEVLVYPIAGNDTATESYTKYAMAKPLNKAMMVWFFKQELSSMAQAADPRVNLVKANLAGLPPTFIIGAELDPLQSEGKMLSDKLKDAKVDTDYKLYDGVTHEFFGMASVVPQAKDAQQEAISKLKSAFNK